MNSRTTQLLTVGLSLLPLFCSACGLFKRANQATDADSVTATAPVAPPPMQVAGAAAGSGGGGRAAPPNPFGIMSSIVPATMPAMAAGAAGVVAPPVVAPTMVATPMAAATAGVPAAGAPSVTGMAGAAAGAMAAAPAAGVMASSGAAGQPASAGFDPATFDEAHGRSRRTAPPGSPVEMGGMMCPNEVCKPLPELPAQAASAGVSVSLCCTPEGECGTKGSAPMSMTDPNTCRIIPDSDPQCARLELMGFEIASCCTADGKCGLNGQAFMMKPCGSIEEAMSMFGGFIELPPAAACVAGMGPPLSSSAPPAGAASGAAGAVATAPAAGSPAVAGAAAPPAAGSGAPIAGSAAP